MRVYDLGCAQDHRFEGWFRSAEDYDAQRAGGLVECPLCGSQDVRRLLSAPKLGRSRPPGAAEEKTLDGPAELPAAAQPSGMPRQPDRGEQAVAVRGEPASASRQALHAAWLRLAQRVVAATEDVGVRFADEARRIHYDEAPARPIRGTATPRQAAELADEGIEVMALPMPASLKGPLQ